MRNSGQWSVVGGQGRGERREERGEGRAFPPLALRSPPSAFTLIELLVTITIIGIMSGLVFGRVALRPRDGRRRRHQSHHRQTQRHYYEAV